MSVNVGIDLGTSNVVVAYLQGGELAYHVWGELGTNVLLPAYIQFREGNTLVGKPAWRNWAEGESGCHHRFKMRIGREEGAVEVSADQLMMTLVNTVRHSLLGDQLRPTEIASIGEAVITVPHGWQEQQRDATRRAVEQAGIPVKRLVSEPIAAAAYYAYVRRLERPERVLVCDMGGGTFDITLTEVHPGHRIQVLEHGTDMNEYAGTYADALIAAHILAQVEGRQIAAETLLQDQQNADIRWLLRSIENARLRLNELADNPEEGDTERIRLRKGKGAPTYELSYEEMCALIKPVCDAAQQLIRRLLSAHQDKLPQGVVLAGGMSKMRVVQQAIANATGFPMAYLVDLGQHSDQAIARGAALIAEDRVQVDEVLPIGIGIVAAAADDEQREVMVPVVESGVRVPVKRRADVQFEVTKRTRELEIRIALIDPHDPRAWEQIIHRYRLEDWLPQGTKYQIEIEVDESLLLQITALRETGEREVIPIRLDDVLRGSLRVVP